MKLSDMKNGYIAKMKNGATAVYIGGKFHDIKDAPYRIGNYTGGTSEDLTDPDYDEFSIIAVQKTSMAKALRITAGLEKSDECWDWERETEEKIPALTDLRDGNLIKMQHGGITLYIGGYLYNVYRPYSTFGNGLNADFEVFTKDLRERDFVNGRTDRDDFTIISIKNSDLREALNIILTEKLEYITWDWKRKGIECND